MRNIDVIFRELQEHPEYIAGVIWTTEDLMHTMILQRHDDDTKTEPSDENIAKFASHLDMNGWEDVAIQDGWDVIVQQYIDIFEEGE